MIEEEYLKPRTSIKKRIAVGAFLTLAVTATHWLPGRAIVTDQLEASPVAAVASAENQVSGANSLLGEVVVDKTAQSLAAADLTAYHLDSEATIDQAGFSKLLNSMVPLTGDSASSMDDAANTQAISQASAVPEPKFAGLLLLAAVPVLVRRKGRVA